MEKTPLHHHNDEIFGKVEKETVGNTELPHHSLLPLVLFWLRRSGDLTLLSDPRHKEDLYQEISSFFTKQDVEHPDSDYSKLEEEEMRELNNSFKHMLRAFKKKQGLFKEGLYDDVHPIHEGEEVDLIANIPKTGARADMIERAVFHIGFYCDTALKEHPLGSEVCKKIEA